jgi:B12-binding domain/radical SAM domain protein of rhizo-twelve system
VQGEVARLRPDAVVVTTAPSYLFWRCAPPELRVPIETARALHALAEIVIGVGPHASTTPRATLKKLDADVVVMGECEEVLCALARTPRARWGEISSIAYDDRVQGAPAAADVRRLPALAWDASFVRAHAHHHHRFDTKPEGPGAELEASRGCPYHCTFCAKDNFRDKFRKRPLEIVLEELDGLIRAGARYVYFVDEIFVPDRPLLEALASRDVAFGVQMRIDNWSPEMLDLLGRAGCVSMEAGVESITERGRSLLAKKCKATTDELTALLVRAKRSVAFVQANLLGAGDDPREVAAWRARLQGSGVWSNEPVPLFRYPGSPEYTQKWGPPDDRAWERAHAQYLADFESFSDIQDARPRPIAELEAEATP